MTTDNLAELLTWLGVAVALVACLVVAPNAPKQIWANTSGIRGTLRAKLAIVFSSLRQASQVQAVSSSIGFSYATLVDPDALPWSESASDRDKISLLRADVLLLEQRLTDVGAAASDQVRILRLDVNELRESVTKAIALLQEQIDADRKSANDLDARGLLPIGLGIVLTSVPGRLSSVGWLGWLAAAMAAIFLLWAGRTLWKHWRDPLPAPTAL